MKVKELRELLADLPDDMEVICSGDAEGNSHGPLYGAWVGFFKKEGYREGYVVGDDESFDDYEDMMEQEEWDELTSGPKSLILTPA